MDDVARLRLRLVSPSEAPSLDGLLQATGRGDRAAFDQLYDEVSGLVYGLVLRVVRDPSLAEDVSQEALVEIWRRAPLFDVQRGSARSFVARIAHARAVDRVRSEQAHRDRNERDFARTPETTEPAAAETVTALHEAAAIRDALRNLTQTQRQAVTLAFYDGRTHREVAELLDIPLGTAKTRIRDGLIKLRDTLQEQGWTR